MSIAALPRLRAFAAAARSQARALSSERYDVVVVGGGPGGYVAAIKASQLGLKTACVESRAARQSTLRDAAAPPTRPVATRRSRGTLGGTCLNVGCIPSKALLHSSHLYEEATKHFKDHGIVVNDVKVDLDKMMANKASSVDSLTGGIEFLFKKYKVDYLQGKGTLQGPNSVGVALNDGGAETLDAAHILLATGSEVSPLPPCPVDNAGGRIVDSTGALDLKEIPKTMAVIGGGAVPRRHQISGRPRRPDGVGPDGGPPRATHR